MEIETSLSNHLLIAMPGVLDPNFEQTVIYVCEHHPKGTVGLIINRPMPFPMSLVFDQLNIKASHPAINHQPLLFGGPVQPERGFVIHRPTGGWRSSLTLEHNITVTTSNDIIRAIANDTGPKDMLVTLGYSAWEDKQLEREILNNTWLVCPFTSEILYDVPFSERWAYAALTIGVKINQLTSHIGHA